MNEDRIENAVSECLSLIKSTDRMYGQIQGFLVELAERPGWTKATVLQVQHDIVQTVIQPNWTPRQ